MGRTSGITGWNSYLNMQHISAASVVVFVFFFAPVLKGHLAVHLAQLVFPSGEERLQRATGKAKLMWYL